MLSVSGKFFDPVSGVYQILNTETDRCYIGQSASIPSRVAQHFTNLGNGCHNLAMMQRDFDEYGPESFWVAAVKIVDNPDDLLSTEEEIALGLVASGVELYNARIGGWVNQKEYMAKRQRRRVKSRQGGKLRGKRRNEDVSTNSVAGNRGNLQKDQKLQGSRGDSGDSTGTRMEGDQRRLPVKESDLLPGKSGTNRAPPTERPAPACMAENRQREKSNRNIRKALSAFESGQALKRELNGTAHNRADEIIDFMRNTRIIKERIPCAISEFGVTAVANALDIHRAHIYNVRNGKRDVSPSLQEAMENKGVWYAERKTQKRWACDIPEGVDEERYREAMRRYARLAVGEAL